jgi:hypothetical protein
MGDRFDSKSVMLTFELFLGCDGLFHFAISFVVVRRLMMSKKDKNDDSDDGLLRRSVTIDLIPPDDRYKDVINHIRQYRATAKQCYAILLMAQTAGADLNFSKDGTFSLKPNSKRSKKLMELAFDKAGKALAYELREYVLQHLIQGFHSFVWDSIRRDITQVWVSKDQEFNNASRGWLALQGARGIAQFNHRGIGFPNTLVHNLDAHRLSLTWHHDIGPVEFKVPRLDCRKYNIWRALRDGDEGWKVGTLYLNERDGLIRAVVSYCKPAELKNLNTNYVCAITTDCESNDTLFKIIGPQGSDTIDNYEVISWLKMMKARRENLEARRASCGNPKRPWGHRHGWLASQDVLSRLTMKREKGVADRNHAWSRRIISRAVSWNCGTLEIGKLPELMYGCPWKWQQFSEFLKYKAEEIGMVFRDSSDLELALVGQ